MKFKNYRNSYTKDNRIYSKQEMLEMPVKEFKNRAEEFIAQHVINVNKNEKGEIIVYDPQTGKGGICESAKQYIGNYVESPSNLRTFQVLRVDDKAFNPDYINKVVKPRSKR